eukprot:6860386-Karenia_brevis.AAC.1
MFKQPAHIATSKTRVRMLQKCLMKDFADVPEAKKNDVVWLDRAKTRQELRPARLIHRMGDHLADVEREKNSDLKVEKNHEWQVYQSWWPEGLLFLAWGYQLDNTCQDSLQ